MSGDHLLAKLRSAFVINEDDNRAIARASSDVRSIKAREVLIRAGERPSGAMLILEGAACRAKKLTDGRRQIASFMLPGDMCDPRVCFLKSIDHSIVATSPLTVAILSWAKVRDLTEGRPGLTRAMLWSKQVDEAIGREWALSLGQRSATEKVAHLICELFVRLERVGLAGPDGFTLPMPQSDLAAALGLSIVHTNRVMQKLRSDKLLILRGRQVLMPRFDALAALAHFSPGYLDLGYRLRKANFSDEPVKA